MGRRGVGKGQRLHWGCTVHDGGGPTGGGAVSRGLYAVQRLRRREFAVQQVRHRARLCLLCARHADHLHTNERALTMRLLQSRLCILLHIAFIEKAELQLLTIGVNEELLKGPSTYDPKP